jgi:hypothetical protein
MDKAKDLEEQRLMKLLKSTFEGGFMLGCRIAGRAAPFSTTEMEATWKALESTSSDGVRVILDAARKAGRPWLTFAVTRKAGKTRPSGYPSDWYCYLYCLAVAFEQRTKLTVR